MLVTQTRQIPAANKSTAYTQLRAAKLQGNAQDQTQRQSANVQHQSALHVQVQGVDFSQWLLQNTMQHDHVALHVDIAGAERDVIAQLIADGSVLLIDSIEIVWHKDLQPELAEWPRHIEQILDNLGVQHA